jgi:sugar phosphate isomerase/epimerase
MRELAGDVSLLSINTATLRKQLALPAIIEACARRGIGALCPWRDQVQAASLAQFARQLKDARLVLTGYCRGGFFPAADAAGLRAALEDNRRAVDEAKALGAPCLVLVVGALPGALVGKPSHTDIGLARAQVHDGIAATLEYARGVGMPLAIEPLHPMQGADRACINTLEHALDICDALDRGAGRCARRLSRVVGPKARRPDRAGRPRPAARLSRVRLAVADATSSTTAA